MTSARKIKANRANARVSTGTENKAGQIKDGKKCALARIKFIHAC